MPRQSRGRSSAPAARSAPAPAQSRGAHTAAMPASAAPHSAAHAPTPAAHHPPAAAASSGQPGMMAQMAATAGSVAIGSTIGHGLSSMLFGGSSSTPAPPAPAADMTAATPAPYASARSGGLSCEVQAKDFTQCLEKADLPSCTWYLEQLKACQAAAAPY
ncbi:hypothetical protein D9757_004437 [Collybiopsis confluens]|uniref:CHCH domain-containing protein n=1 Tax=Collybiopsis confluens TaxID=2823264 RepID=A0A8H5MEM1_9AGAR|nr:hypothetical protein D9757_004437 [Collybiopsis confluens]